MTPAIENEFNRTFTAHALAAVRRAARRSPGAVQHDGEVRQLKAGAPNPFVDPANCWVEAEIQEAMLRAQVRMQKLGK